MQISTFGQVLEWVRDRLEQVEKNMPSNPSYNHETIQNLSSARCAVDALINTQDPNLEDEYIKAAETEYEALVEFIQERPRPLTDRTIAVVEQISSDMGETPGRIAQEKELMKRMRGEQP